MSDRSSSRVFYRLACLLLWLVVTSGVQAADEVNDSSTTVEVVSASKFVVTEQGKEALWTLAGVWTPRPADGFTVAEYQGDAAKEIVRYVLGSFRVEIDDGWIAKASGEQLVQLSVIVPNSEFQEVDGRVDLAELLAREGMALCDRTSASSSEQADRICSAEREARRDRRGLHDGGYTNHAQNRLKTIDIGQLSSEHLARVFSSSRETEPGSSSPLGEQQELLGDPRELIRDYGASMGLPRDSSRAGQ